MGYRYGVKREGDKKHFDYRRVQSTCMRIAYRIMYCMSKMEYCTCTSVHCVYTYIGYELFIEGCCIAYSDFSIRNNCTSSKSPFAAS